MNILYSIRGVLLLWGVLGLAWSGVLKLVERFLYISWHVYFQYACLVVTVQCDATVETPSPIFCDIISLLECMYEVHYVLFLLYFISNISTTSMNVIPFLL